MNWKHTATTVILAALVSVGCGTSSPTMVAKQFFVVIEKGDVDSYNKVMTPETTQTVIMLGEKMKQSLKVKGGITNMTESIDGDKATVEVTFKDGSKEKLDLVKVDGKWKVSTGKK